jgi:hypothetical protein
LAVPRAPSEVSRVFAGQLIFVRWTRKSSAEAQQQASYETGVALSQLHASAVTLVHIRSLDERDWRGYLRGFPTNLESMKMTKKATSARREYSKDDVKLLKAHSKARTPVTKLSKLMKRSEGSLRQKARTLGIGLGHQR